MRVPPGALHVCYCFTPMRYVWDLYDDYFGARAGALTRLLMPPVAAALRRWDRRTAAGVHHFVGISRFIADRIRRCYGRDADVIYPPVDVARFRIEERPEDFYLVVSALAPYKRVDLAVEAASRLGRRLVVVGTGPEEARLRARAGPTVRVPRLEGRRPGGRALRALPRAPVPHRGGLRHHAAGGHGGRPSRHRAGAGGRAGDGGAAGRGRSRPPGSSSRRQTVDDLADAMRRFESGATVFEPKALRRHAERFDRPIFKERMAGYLGGGAGEGARVLKALLACARASHAGGRSHPRGGLLARSPTSCASTSSAPRAAPRRFPRSAPTSS